MAPKVEDRPFRIVLIETFIQVPPTTDYSRGYFACLMDDASNDIDDAGTDVFDRALACIRDESHRASLMRQRAFTLNQSV